MKERRNHAIWLTGVAALLLLAGCHKKQVAPPAQPAPPPPAPTASLSANPDSIEAGQSTTLSWQTQNATDISIDQGVGTVEATGSKSVSPSDSTTYHLTAKGPGGTQEATARVTVTQPAPPSQPSETEEQMFARNVQDVFFDYDKYDLRPEAVQSLSQAAAFLKQHTNLSFTIEGHCDERGSTEYNLALGQKRAQAAADALIQDGVDTGRITTYSYGKEKPFCTESNEQCWQQNRRAHFVLKK